jgi:hypothetical protein
MADPPQDNAPDTTMGTISKLGSQVISALTPQAFALIVLNILFIGVLFWFVNARAEHTAAVITQLLEACLHAKS